MTSENQTNKVFLCGTVITPPELSHELYGEGFYEFRISVPRLSSQCDELPITVPERLMTSKPDVGDTIAVYGQFRSYNKMIDNRSKLMLTVFVKEFADVMTCANPNSVDLIGYVCKEPVYRTTPLSREICDVLVAVNRAFNKSDYIPCIAWGRNARFCRTLPVGARIAISGRLQSRLYVKKLSETESETRTAYEISVSRIEQCESEEVAATTDEPEEG